MKALTLTLKIALTVSALLYSSVAVPQPAVVYILWIYFSALPAAAAALRNNQCAFCWLKGHQKLWNEEPSCSLLIMFIQTGKVHLNENKQIMWKTADKLESEVTLNTYEEKCQAETVKKALKSLSESQ